MVLDVMDAVGEARGHAVIGLRICLTSEPVQIPTRLQAFHQFNSSSIGLPSSYTAVRK